ncbi:hypothetical protein [Sphingomonas glaciei]|uniref:DUF11 domain-containing protein n=1 Tax=Sphingomonas glaciei TaxID=2938948 RepID=A0ABY5MVE2_9SPHN|nr:hypothetical protein [Sphingomonas glaciei]UUR08450.1 hypothetical protein M1K48_02035 [Sphingomonas glaciei]
MTRQVEGRIGRQARIALSVALCAASAAAFAEGTPAGTDIVNVAQLSWIDGGDKRTVQSNPASLKVDERIDVAIAWLDGGSVPVAPGEQNRVLSFRVVNAGNAPEAFVLSAIGAIGGDQWDPAITSLALDTNGNGLFDPGVDQTYRAGVDDPLLKADASVTVFVLGTVPTGLADAAVGLASLRATAVTGSGSPGTVFAGRGESGTDAVVGGTTATAVTQGSLVASLAVPQLAKAQQIVDPNGGSSALPGALITYTLSASYGGSVPTSGALVEDPIPAGTSYVPGSLKLNGMGLTDAADGDAGEVGAAGIRVAIGALSASSSAVISFQVRVNS